MKHSLCTLPPECVAEITSKLSPLDVAKLWISGNAGLQRALGAGGVLEFRLRPPALLRLFWPSLVSSFSKLASFELSDFNSNPSRRVTGTHILLLPRTVARLILHFEGSYVAFQEAISDDPATSFLFLRTLELIDSNETLQQRSYVPRWPRSLTRLSLHSFAIPLDLTTLPPHLEELRCDYYLESEQKPTVLAGELPKSLRYLVVNADLQCCALLVPFLTSLEFLETLSLEFPPSQQDSHEAIYSATRPDSMPPEQFFIDLRQLPRNMTSLRLPMRTVTREILEALPRTLIEFAPTVEIAERFGFHGTSNELIPFWPPLLQYSHPLLPTTLSRSTLQCLPKTITDLRIFEDTALIPHIPPLVRQVSAIGSIPALLSELFSLGITKLPTQLTSLSFHSSAPCSREQAEIFLAALPACLTSLSAPIGDLSSDSLKLLPPHLINLSTGSKPLCTRTRDWELLPRSLQHLCIHIQKRTLKDVHSRNLPPHLKTLRIVMKEHVVRIGKGWFEALPETLTSLTHVGIADGLLDDWLISLPKNLSTFEIQFQPPPSEGLRNLFASLPNTINTCRIHCPSTTTPCQLQDSDLKLLKKPILQYLKLPAANLTQICLKYLPKSLRSFQLGNRTPSWFVPYIRKTEE